MSILLDALKRSESQRELGSVPTLQTTIDETGSMGRDGNSWLAAVMILLAAGMIGWMGWEQFRQPEALLTESTGQQASSGQMDSDQAGTAESSEAISLSQIANKSSNSEGNILPKIDGPLATGDQQSQADDRESQQRSVGRDFREYSAEEATPTAAEAANTTSLDNAVRQREIASVNLDSSAQTASATNPEATYEPETISYWQMPESTREGLPELRISVLVYAERPENRFLLLNGERIREGDELPNGLRLEEIRRDRAIFNYRNYRFHLKS